MYERWVGCQQQIWLTLWLTINLNFGAPRPQFSRKSIDVGRRGVLIRTALGALVGRVYWHNIASMPIFDSRFWNLSQAAAWVVYRKRKLVEQFSVQSADGWRALVLYPENERVGDLDELVNALTLGKLTALGRGWGVNEKLEEIPAREWDDLEISPPFIYRSRPSGGRIEPWTGLKFKGGDLKKLWRSLADTEARTLYNWDPFDEIWEEQKRLHPLFSKNLLGSEPNLTY